MSVIGSERVFEWCSGRGKRIEDIEQMFEYSPLYSVCLNKKGTTYLYLLLYIHSHTNKERKMKSLIMTLYVISVLGALLMIGIYQIEYACLCLLIGLHALMWREK